MYEIIKKHNDTEYIKRLSDGASISIEQTNPDYQAYLKWVAEGNTPEPAEGAE
jgi:hypothetical protein